MKPNYHCLGMKNPLYKKLFDEWGDPTDIQLRAILSKHNMTMNDLYNIMVDIEQLPDRQKKGVKLWRMVMDEGITGTQGINKGKLVSTTGKQVSTTSKRVSTTDKRVQ
jgi:hypothetical protein